MRHVTSSSGVATLRTAIHLLLTYMSVYCRKVWGIAVPLSTARFVARVRLHLPSQPLRRVHLSRPNLIARSTIDMPWRNCPSAEFRKSSRGKYCYFARYLDFLTTPCKITRKKPPCQNQLDPSIRFDRTLICDRQVQTQTDTGP